MCEHVLAAFAAFQTLRPSCGVQPTVMIDLYSSKSICGGGGGREAGGWIWRCVGCVCVYTGAGDLGDRGEILAWPSGVMVSANFIITSTREAISSGAASFIEPESSAYEGSERGWEFGGIGLRGLHIP